MTHRSAIRILGLLLASGFAPSISAAGKSSLNPAQTISLPGVSGRFDHSSIDIKGRRLFVAALGNNSLEIIDVGGGRRLHSLKNLRKPTGVLYLPEPNRICVANGEDGTLKIFDGTTYEMVSSIPSLEDADNVRFDAGQKVVFVGYGDGALALIDANSFKQTASIKFRGHPESFQFEQKGHRLFVNIPDANQVAVIDRAQNTVSATWAMREFKANFPMALDEENRRLFIGCRSPARLVVLDTESGQAISSLPISGDTDDLFYDPPLKRIYLSCGEGFINVVDQRNPDRYELREKIATARGARTSYLSADLRQFFLAVPKQDKKEAEIRVFRVDP